jgi:hypothetical protein
MCVLILLETVKRIRLARKRLELGGDALLAGHLRARGVDTLEPLLGSEVRIEANTDWINRLDMWSVQTVANQISVPVLGNETGLFILIILDGLPGATLCGSIDGWTHVVGAVAVRAPLLLTCH